LEYSRDSGGRRLQTSKAGFPTKAAAQTALQQAVRTFMTDVNVTTLTVGEYLEAWLTGKHALKPKTVSLYRDFTTNYLVPNLGEIRLLQLRAHHLDRMYASITLGRRGRPLSPATIRRVHAVLRSALNTAVKRRLIPYSPAEQVELAPENPKRPKPWTAEQCQTFLRDIADDRLANLYDLILVTGMRRGEAIGLRWEDVDLDGQCLFVVQQITEVHGRAVVGTPKTKRGTRLVPIDDGTVAMLRRHREMQDVERTAWGPAWNDAGLVFTREDGRPLRPEYATRHFQALADLAGLPPIRLHDLRHTNASLALQAGVDMKVVSERLGHSQMSITADLYTHVNQGLGRVAAEQIAGVLRTPSETLPSAFLAQTPENSPRKGGEADLHP
jgi:integrase